MLIMCTSLSSSLLPPISHHAQQARKPTGLAPHRLESDNFIKVLHSEAFFMTLGPLTVTWHATMRSFNVTKITQSIYERH